MVSARGVLTAFGVRLVVWGEKWGEWENYSLR